MICWFERGARSVFALRCSNNAEATPWVEGGGACPIAQKIAEERAHVCSTCVTGPEARVENVSVITGRADFALRLADFALRARAHCALGSDVVRTRWSLAALVSDHVGF